MKRKEHLMSAATSLAFAGLTLATFGAAAQAPGIDPFMLEAKSLKSRAEVRAELEQARADGSIREAAESYDFAAATRSMKSRDDVRREVQLARLTGELSVMNAEAYDFTHTATQRVARR